MIEIERGRVAGDGVELAYGRWRGAGRPLVAIHGLTATHLNFVGIAECLAGRRALFAPDLRGRGGSDRGDGWGVEQHARDVAAAMRAADLGPTVLVGHSLGAYVAIAVAAAFPELVRGLVLIDGGLLPALPPGVDARALAAVGLEPLAARIARSWPSRDAYKAAVVGNAFRPDEDSPWLDAYVDYDLAGAPPALRSRTHEPAIRADFFDLARRDDGLARAVRVRAPILTLRAPFGLRHQQPPVVPDSVVGDLRRLGLEVTDVVVPGTTHYTIALGRPGAAAVADAVAAFAAAHA